MLKVGGEVDSLCTRCEMTLAHTIIAMVGGAPVKVECNTCHGVHRFRGDLPRAARAAAGKKAPRALAAAGPARSFDEALRGKRLELAQRYSPRARFELDQVIEHPTFGMGWVSAVRDATKVEVTFRDEVRVLVHGKS